MIQNNPKKNLNLKICCVLFLVGLYVQLSQGKLTNHQKLNVNLDEVQGSFNISVGDHLWFGSSGKGVSLRLNGTIYAIDASNLFIDEIKYYKGHNGIGKYNGIDISYAIINNDAQRISVMIGTIQIYRRAITFAQKILIDLNNTSSGDADGVMTSFPVLDIDSQSHVPDSSCLWTSWDDEFSSTTLLERDESLLVAPGFLSPTCRAWSSTVQLPGGIAGTGPMVIWSEKLMSSSSTATSSSSINFPAFVLSPMENTMVMNLDAARGSAKTGRAAYGIMGNVTSVPAGFTTKTMLLLGEGINGAISDWGRTMRQWHGKQDAASARRSDITLQYLGYSTDNGAYYYYNTVKGMNYEDTMAAIRADADALQLPMAYTLLDSWWYEHGSQDGVEKWDAVSSVFPNGMKGVYNQTNWLIQAHNRWWDPSNVYATQNGGEFDFIIDQDKGGAVPLQQAFWDEFLRGKAEWGLRVYEQDWLWNEFAEKVTAMMEDPHLGRRWLTQMGRGAQKNGLTIQYCMPHMRHLLQSLESQVVTQARASDDYKPGNQQWAIGGQNVLFDALGLAPSKDSYWSTNTEQGNPYEGTPNEFEPFPDTQSAVVTLSAGPVAPSDGIGMGDSCSPLRRQSSLTEPFDTERIQTVMDVAGEVWGAWSETSDRVFGYVFAANVTTSSSLTPLDLQHLGSPSSSNAFKPTSRNFDDEEEEDSLFGYFAVNVRDVLSLNRDGNQNTVIAQEFSVVNPLVVVPCGQDDFALWAILPVEANGWAFYGEVNKWIGASAARVLKISSTTAGSNNESILVELIGSVDEVLSVGFVDPLDNSLVVVQCTVSETGRVTVSPLGCV